MNRIKMEIDRVYKRAYQNTFVSTWAKERVWVSNELLMMMLPYTNNHMVIRRQTEQCVAGGFHA